MITPGFPHQPLWPAARVPRAPHRCGAHPTRQARIRQAEVFGGDKHGFFSACLRIPFRERVPVKFYFPLQTTFYAAKN